MCIRDRNNVLTVSKYKYTKETTFWNRNNEIKKITTMKVPIKDIFLPIKCLQENLVKLVPFNSDLRITRTDLGINILHNKNMKVKKPCRVIRET